MFRLNLEWGNKTKQLEQKSGTPIGLTESVGKFWSMVGGKPVMIDLSSVSNYSKAYQYCPPVTSIINQTAECFGNGYWSIVNEKGEEVITDISSLVQAPNPLQSWGEFISQHKIFKRIYGYGIILQVKAAGFSSPMALWNLPNWACTIIEKRKAPIYSPSFKDMVERITVDYSGVTLNLNLDDVLVIRDKTVSMNTLILPESRLRALHYPVNNIMATLKARGILASRNGMPLGALVNGNKDGIGSTIPIAPKEKDNIQKTLREYGMDENLAQIVVTNESLQWLSFSFPTRDLMLMEEIQDDVKQVCWAFGIPIELTPYGSETAFDNQEQGWKRVYQDMVIPESNNDAEIFTKFFKLNQKKLHFKVKYDHLPVLQTDVSKANTAAKALDEALAIEWQNDLITLNEWRTARGYEPDAVNGDLKRSEYLRLTAPTPEPTPIPATNGNAN